MFDATTVALKKIANDFKRIVTGLHIGTQILTIAYLLYTVIVGTGVLVANIILLVLTCAYFAFYLYMITRGVKKQTKRFVKEAFRWSKRCVKLLTIGVFAYGLFVEAKNFSPISFFILVFMVFGWAMEFLFYLVGKFIQTKIDFVIDAAKTDVAPIVKTINLFKKATFSDPIEFSAPSDKNAAVIEEAIANAKADKKEKKRIKHAQRKENFLRIFKKK